MITLLLINDGALLLALLLLLGAARLGVARIVITRPAQRKNGGTT